jgi:hypothetical protein
MQIKMRWDARRQTLDPYSIQDVTVHVGGGGRRLREKDDGSTIPWPDACIEVALTPEPSTRFRGYSSSYEAKKYGAEALFIDGDELERMVGALKKELTYCYVVLGENKLLDNLNALKKKWG